MALGSRVGVLQSVDVDVLPSLSLTPSQARREAEARKQERMREIAAEEKSRSEAAAKKDRIEKDIARVQRQTCRSLRERGDGSNEQDTPPAR